MIIANGTIEIKSKSAGGIDPVTGFPRKADAEWGKPIPCQYTVSSMNKLARALGNAKTEQAYEILIEEQPFEAEQIRLTDTATGKVIGEFSIKSVEPLQAVSELRLQI